ncbi:MAG: hypothetical protein NTU88_10370 [Armatimonadetes bacterium]|nr:hypothetical protein [Armatimonadota bacterium]
MMRSECYVTPVFGLTKGELRPIVEEAAGDAVVSFDVSMEHQRPEPYGYQAEKEIPTFDYVTRTGRAGRVTVFVKRFYRTGPAESEQYRFLLAHQAPIPRMYGVLPGPDQREILFVEHVETPHPIGTMRELLALMARFHAIRPSVEYTAWLERMPWGFHDRLASAEHTLDLIWEHARNGELGAALKNFCSSSRHRLRQLQSVVRQVIERTLEMPRGLIHTDFSRENTGRRKDGELLALDVEWVTLGPRFFDVAGSLAWPPQRWHPDLRQGELGRHYLEEYARWGGSPPSLETFFDEIRLLWFADKLRYLDWNLNRGLDGSAASPADDERRACRDELYRTLTAFLAQYLLRGTNCSVLLRR